MVSFAWVLTCTFCAEVCRLRWEWEVEVPELQSSVFLVPPSDQHGGLVKNGEERLVVLNDVACSVMDEIRAGGAETCASKPPLTLPSPPAGGGRGEERDLRGRVCVHVPRTAYREDEQHGMEAGLAEGGVASGRGVDAGSAFAEAHIRSQASRRWCTARDASGVARPQEPRHHESLLSP